jgi:hypothetical protein
MRMFKFLGSTVSDLRELKRDLSAFVSEGILYEFFMTQPMTTKTEKMNSFLAKHKRGILEVIKKLDEHREYEEEKDMLEELRGYLDYLSKVKIHEREGTLEQRDRIAEEIATRVSRISQDINGEYGGDFLQRYVEVAKRGFYSVKYSPHD